MADPNIPNTRDSTDKEIIVFKPGKNDKIATTLKAYQTIYDHITGEKQKINKEYFIDYDIGFPQLDQLNIKIGQLLKQYNIASKNCSVVVMHEDEDQETFDSYENFSTYNISNIHPITVINIRYNFSLLTPSNSEINNYTFNISITPGMIPPMELRNNYRRLRYVGPTIKTEMEYADYVVARTIIENVSDWVKSIEVQEKKHYVSEFFSKQSEYVASFLRNGSLLVLVTIILINNKKIMPEYILDMNKLFIVFVIIGTVIFITYRIVNHFCFLLFFSLENKEKQSFISINDGDRKLKQRIEKQNKNNIFKSIGSFFMTLLITFISGIIIKIIFKI
jgi:hypothetical protein